MSFPDLPEQLKAAIKEEISNTIAMAELIPRRLAPDNQETYAMGKTRGLQLALRMLRELQYDARGFKKENHYSFDIQTDGEGNK